eukprot:COSAG06_NODE_4224_length_4453_cov_275.939136_1_plen_141_part_00
MPRQARDEHRETLTKEPFLTPHAGGQPEGVADGSAGEKKPSTKTNAAVFFRFSKTHFATVNNILPRQARDKRVLKTQNETKTMPSADCYEVRKRLFARFLHENMSTFTKTGSGQTQGKHSKRGRPHFAGCAQRSCSHSQR